MESRGADGLMAVNESWFGAVSVGWIELITKAYRTGCCPLALTRTELLSNRKLKNSCNADALLLAVALWLRLPLLWTSATEQVLFLFLIYFFSSNNTNMGTIRVIAKIGCFSIWFFLLCFLSGCISLTKFTLFHQATVINPTVSAKRDIFWAKFRVGEQWWLL